MVDLRLKNVLAQLPGNTQPERVDIDVSGTLIAGIRKAPDYASDVPQARETMDGSTLLAVPGFINGHHHSHENFHKGRYAGLPLELWMNFVRPLRPIPFTAEQVYLRTMISAIEALRSGTTTIVDDMNVSPILREDHVEAAFRAYEDIGIRAHLGITLFDRPFFRGVPFVEDHVPPALLDTLSQTDATPPDAVLAYARHLAETRHHKNNRVAYIAAPSAPQRCTDDFLIRIREMADSYDLPTIIHVHETRLQVVTGQAFYGTSMIAHLDTLGFLKPATSVIHGVWVTPDDLDVLARTGASVQHNPNSNLKLGSGLMPMRQMLDRGINVSLGTDGCGSIESVDMLRVLASTTLQTVRDGPHSEWITPLEAFIAATVGGATALGRSDIGALHIGAKADIALYDTRSIAFTPCNRPLQQLVLAETGRGLKHLIVDGAFVLRDNAITRVDENDLIQRIHAAAAELSPEIEASEHSTERLRPSYEAIFEQCCQTPISADVLPTKVPMPGAREGACSVPAPSPTLSPSRQGGASGAPIPTGRGAPSNRDAPAAVRMKPRSYQPSPAPGPCDICGKGPEPHPPTQKPQGNQHDQIQTHPPEPSDRRRRKPCGADAGHPPGFCSDNPGRYQGGGRAAHRLRSHLPPVHIPRPR